MSGTEPMHLNITSLADIEAVEQTPLSAQNLPKSTYDAIRQSAQRHPQEIAIRYIENGDAWKLSVDSGLKDAATTFSYTQLLENINRSANLFRSLGVTDTEVVSLVLPNVPEAYFAMWGAEAAGIVNPINYLLDASEIGEIAQSAGCRVLVIMGVHSDFNIIEKLTEIKAHAPCIKHILVVGPMPEDVEECQPFDAAMKTMSGDGLDFEREIASNDIASLFHTGGTTGLPKLAQHTHGNEVYTAWALNLILSYKPGESSLVGLPLFHCNAAIASGLSGFMSGCCVLMAGIAGYRSPGIVKNLFHLIERYHVAGFSGVPTIYATLVQLPIDGVDLSSLRIAGCGAAPMPVELFNRFETQTGIKISEGYGLTEATVCSTMSPPDSDQPRIGSIGIRIPYTNVKAAIIDAEGSFVRDCEVEEVGVVLINGPSVTPGYTDQMKNDDLFVTDSDGAKWLNTGDLARQDSDGYFWLTGRAKELIIRGGHNIDPKQIEEVLATHTSVNLAAAIGRPDSYAGEVPVAYVDTVSAVSEEELLSYCQKHIGERAAIPKAITILDTLPVTGVGKIHKPTLHLMELKSTVERELDQLSDEIAMYQVDTVSDPKLGRTAIIKMTGTGVVSPETLEKTVQERLGVFSFAYSLEIAGNDV